MSGPGRTQFANVFKNVAERCKNTAQARLIAQMDNIMERVHEHAINYQHSKFGNMTGNWINSFGVALYRDGRLVAIGDMSGQEDSPIRTTLVNDEVFKRGTRRFDSTYQSKSFEVGYNPDRMGSSSNYFANEEVVRWLSHSSTRKKGFSFRLVSVTEYEKDTARRVLLQVSDEIESAGGNIWRFNLG